MLDFLRKQTKSWLTFIAFGFIILSFVVWGGFRGNEGGQMAEVDGQVISKADYDKFYREVLDMYRRQLGNAFSEEFIRQLGLEKRALEMMIQRYLILKAAHQMGLVAGSQEVQQTILQIPVLQTDGQFDKKKYDLFLRQSRRTPEAFEQQMMDDLTLQKVEAFIKRRALVTEDEVLADFRYNHGRVLLSYVLFSQKSYEEKAVMDDQAIQAFYQQNAEKYKDPEKRQFSYVLFSSDAYLGEVKVSGDEIKQYYEDHFTEYNKEKEVRARHILFSAKEDVPEEELTKVRAEAQKVLDEAKKGKDFAELAKKYSQDPSAAQNAGDLGFFTKGKMVPAFSDAAFSMKPGEISDLVRTPFGFHILKVEEVRPEKTSSFEEVRGQVETTLKEQGARDVAFKKAREFSDFAYAQKDIEKASQARNLPLTASSVRLSRNDPLPGVDAAPPEVMGKLFSYNEKEISDPLETPKGFLVVQVLGVQAPQVIPFERAKEQVQKDFRVEEGRKLAFKAASDLLQAARNAKSLEETAKASKLEVKKSDWFSRGEPDKELKLLKGEAMNKVLQLTESEPLPDAPLEMGNRYLVCQLLDKKYPEEKLEKERPAIIRRLQQQKQSMVWQAWLEGQKDLADIKIYARLK